MQMYSKYISRFRESACAESQIRGLFSNCPVSVKCSLSYLLTKSFSNSFLHEGFYSVCMCELDSLRSLQ